ncbi:uncharacterized protein LOC128236971 [Mya arenaria]|uniref:uncharacterized protein LOC128236971 n=1 Tax=Mya arenaria TaxID=6604 RepID=UPI0022E29118|nr:uncharacterized protein LOC128236971 [Mya arenaria]XP_052808090.1 uncharacterized protein LOC128236971 [Mya arenaria]
MPVLEHRVYCSTPESAEHKYHVRGEFGSTFQPLDKVIINRIKALVAEGIRSVSEMKRHLRIFAKQNFPGVSELSNRYFLSNKDIRNHMSATLRLDKQYWECDKCGLRLHPGCIGRDPDETPADSSTTFWCEACLTAVVKVWPVDNFKEFIESGGVSDDEGYIIDATVILSLMHAGYSRCWLIIHAQGKKVKLDGCKDMRHS